MKPEDRKMLEDFRFSPEVIAEAEEVLRPWEIEDLFATCSYCGKQCFNPGLPKGKRRRKKLPADLFAKRELLGFRDSSRRCAAISRQPTMRVVSAA
jgi:hypothetical protein